MGGNIDPTLRTLKSVGRYQLLQVLVINLGYFGAAYQLLGNIFIGKSLSSSSSSTPQSSQQWGTYSRRPSSGVLTADVPPVGYLQQTSHQWGTYSRRPTSGVLTADAATKVTFARNPELSRMTSFKAGVGQNMWPSPKRVLGRSCRSVLETKIATGVVCVCVCVCVCVVSVS